MKPNANIDISNIFTTTFAQGRGIIKLNSEHISVDRNSQVATETKGDSYGGRIYLKANILELNHGGKFSTSTFAADRGGKILLETNQLIGIEYI